MDDWLDMKWLVGTGFPILGGMLVGYIHIRIGGVCQKIAAAREDARKDHDHHSELLENRRKAEVKQYERLDKLGERVARLEAKIEKEK